LKKSAISAPEDIIAEIKKRNFLDAAAISLIM